jgi:hypothetical protein
VPNTLNWSGDGEDWDAIRSLEAIFEISFSNRELEALTDVGSLHDLVQEKLFRANDQGKCASAMAFYRLRQALAAHRPDVRITPGTALNVFRTPYTKRFFSRLEWQTGLKLGGPAHTWIGWWGDAFVLLPLMLVLPLLAIRLFVSFSSYIWLGPILMLPVGLVLLWLDPGRLTGTVGDLARKAARTNYGRLMKQGAKGRDTEVWELLVETLTMESRLKPGEVTRETVFFASQLKAA